MLKWWEVFAEKLQGLGYSTWTGNLHSEQYGVPQTRKRAFLIAALDGEATPPPPTHRRFHSHRRAHGFLRDDDAHLPMWVTMAEALGFDGQVGFRRRDDRGTSPDGYRERDVRETSLPAFVVTEKGRSWEAFIRTGARPEGSPGPQERALDSPATTITSKSGGQWQLVGAKSNHTVRDDDQLAPTITAGHDVPDWCFERLSTTVVGSFSPDTQAAPGYRKAGDGPRQNAPDSVKINVRAGLALQSFPPDCLDGLKVTKTAAFKGIGNAVPPLLAQRVIEHLTQQTGDQQP